MANHGTSHAGVLRISESDGRRLRRFARLPGWRCRRAFANRSKFGLLLFVALSARKPQVDLQRRAERPRGRRVPLAPDHAPRDDPENAERMDDELRARGEEAYALALEDEPR
jgi:hypothetical protein